MKRIGIFALLSSLALLGFTLPASAQWVVVDPTNLVQNIMTAANTLRQIDNQVLQLAHEEQMLVNEARNLQGLNFNVLARLQSTLASTQRLLSSANGLAFDLTRTTDTFRRLYPEAYTAAFSSAQMTADAEERRSNSREALGTAFQMQSQATQNVPLDESTLADLVSQSQSAVGALQVAQVHNQLLALQVHQAMQTQQVQVAQDRAVALEQARAVAAESQAREERSRFMTQQTKYTPEPVSLFTR